MENQNPRADGNTNTGTRKRKPDKFWEYVEQVDDRSQRCKFCGWTCVAKSITKMKKHWCSEPGVEKCSGDVPDHVRSDALGDRNKCENRKQHKLLSAHNSAHEGSSSHSLTSLFDRPKKLFLFEYALFVVICFKACFKYLIGVDILDIRFICNISLAKAMIKKKQDIQNLIRQIKEDNNLVASLLIPEHLENMADDMKQLYRFTAQDYWDILTQGKEKEELYKLIANILVGDVIFPNSKFWISLEAYIHLYNHFDKMLHPFGNDDFTYADYFEAYAEARAIISREDFCKDYETIGEGLDHMIDPKAYNGRVLFYLSPQIRYFTDGDCCTVAIETDILETTTNDNGHKNGLSAQLTSYREKDTTYFKKEAWSSREMTNNSLTWWRKWGDGVPNLKELAIRMLSRLCSTCRIMSLMEDTCRQKSHFRQSGKLSDLLYVRSNYHFKCSTKESQYGGGWRSSASGITCATESLENQNPRADKNTITGDRSNCENGKQQKLQWPRNSAHEGSSSHSPASLVRDSLSSTIKGQAATAAPTQDDINWLLQVYCYFNGFPSYHLCLPEFRRLLEAISAHGSSSPYVLALTPPIDKEYILDKLKPEIDDNVKAIRESWTSTGGCTICLNSVHWHLTAMARCSKGIVFLKCEPLDDECDGLYTRSTFLNSVIEDIGSKNIAQVLLPTDLINESSWVPPYKSLSSLDIRDGLSSAFRSIFVTPQSLFLLKYASFVAICFNACFRDLPEVNKSYHPYVPNMPLQKTMLKNKQNIHKLIREIKEDYNLVATFPFWGSEEDYSNLRKHLEYMAHDLKQLYQFTTLDYSNILTREKEKQELCKLIADILVDDVIFPSSKFWISLEAYIHLYNHFHKMFHLVTNDDFTYADYFEAYAEARGIISKEDFCKDYKRIRWGLDKMIDRDAYEGEALFYLSPQIRYLTDGDYCTQTIQSTILEMTNIDNGNKNDLSAQLTCYREKDTTYFKKEAWSSREMMIHSLTWWRKWGDGVPNLKELAIRMLSRLCSNYHFESLIDIFCYQMGDNFEDGEMSNLLYLRLNYHFKYNTRKGKYGGTTFFGMDMINERSNYDVQCPLEFFNGICNHR